MLGVLTYLLLIGRGPVSHLNTSDSDIYKDAPKLRQLVAEIP
jgi:hypothetical protein